MNRPDAVRTVSLSLVLLAAVAGSGAAQTAPDLLRAVHERQRQMLAEIEDVTLTYDDPYPLVTPTTIHAEQSTGPDGPRLLVRFTKEEGADWRPAREETDLADVFWWLLPWELDERVIAAAVDGGSGVIDGRSVRVIEHRNWEPFLLTGSLIDMTFGLTESIRLFIDPERLLLVRIEVNAKADRFARTGPDTAGITFKDYQEVAGFSYPRTQVQDLDDSRWWDREREQLEQRLAYLRERLEALSGEEDRSVGEIPGIPTRSGLVQGEIESIERYLRGEPEVMLITNVNVDTGPPPGAG